MSFTNPYSVKVDNSSTITAAETNAAGAAIAQAVDGAAGGIITPSGEIDVQGTLGIKFNGSGDARWPRTPSRVYTIAQPLVILGMSQGLIVGAVADGGSGSPAENEARVVTTDGTQTRPLVRTRSRADNGGNLLLLLDAMPDGAIVTAVTIRTKGIGAANNPTQQPTFALVSIPTGDASQSLLSAVTTDAHTWGGGGNYLTTVVATTITPTSGSFTVDKSTAASIYGVYIDPPYDASLSNGLYIYSMTVTFSTTTVRPF